MADEQLPDERRRAPTTDAADDAAAARRDRARLHRSPAASARRDVPGWPASGPQRGRSTRSSSRCSASSATTHPKADLRMIERAYDVAEHHHRGQLRKSGDPYITHPLAVDQILAELGMTPPTLCAALLHDTVEDTAYTPRRSCARTSATRSPTWSTASPSSTRSSTASPPQAETVRKMVVAMARDIRVLVIKLADRLHNMRTMRYHAGQTSRSRRPARPSRSTRRWPTGSA